MEQGAWSRQQVGGRCLLRPTLSDLSPLGPTRLVAQEARLPARQAGGRYAAMVTVIEQAERLCRDWAA